MVKAKATHERPPHIRHAPAVQDDDEEPGESWLWYATKASGKATARWFAAAPAARTPLLALPAIYAAGAAVHAYHLPWWGIGTVTIAGTIVTYASAMNRLQGARIVGASAATAATGGWLAAATEFGVNGGPSGLATWIYLGAFGVGYALHRLGLRPRREKAEKTPEVVDEEIPRIDWDGYLEGWGLAGAEVLKAEPTRLGERVLLDTRGTGKRASSFVSKGLAELIAEEFGLSASRVDVRLGRIAGQLLISVRLQNPWAKPIPHPLLDPHPEIELPEVGDVTRPLIIGQDPETGRPLELVVYDEHGASHIAIIATKGGGKTVVVDNVMERLTAADNCAVWGIDIAKGKNMARWRDAGALGLSACGSKERAKAVRILELGAEITRWREVHSNEAVHQPRPGGPLVEIVVEEIDSLVGGGDQLAQRARAALTTITSKGRSPAVGLVIIGQRGTAEWIGGPNVRANIDRFVLAKMTRATEIMNAVGSDVGSRLPNVTAYGEGHPGVILITDISGNYDLGRSFLLKELDDLERLAEGRRPSDLEPALVEHLGKAYQQLLSGQPITEAVLPASVSAAEEQPQEGMVRAPEERTAERAELGRHLFLLPALPAADAERVREHSAARWEMFKRVESEAEAALPSQVPDDVRAKIMARLGDGEAARPEIEKATGYSPAAVLRFLNQLRGEGSVDMRGRGPATRWFLTGNEHVA
ncbi:winged helix-turn-helix domain-containing protein [Nonomuraea sp. CA-143628]|uniref:winged helix-turn-helix domain-containing protein n=1 Tax=Nonomuraea sp. CA-143628 TaxID=3239997 RepID=UPI003D911626